LSFASLLVHPLALISPTTPDPDDVDERGHPLPGTPTVTLLNGMVQPKTAQQSAFEAQATGQAGAEISTHVIFLLPRQIPPGSWLRDEPDAGRRFDITGVRSFGFGSVPHLEVDVKLVGTTEGPEVGS